MDEYERFVEYYRLIFEHFKNMENRYHTWMNYYSLFNGALLVAYCTILVSTGRILEVGGTIKEQIGDVELKSLQLDCTYWAVLMLVSLLGSVASYFWYLSIIGHCSWLDNWRKILKDCNFQPNNTIYAKNEHIMHTCSGKPVLPGFYSTAFITKLFILFVLLSWLLISVYSWMNYENYEMDILYCFVVSCGLFFFLLFIDKSVGHYLFGSDMSDFILGGTGMKIKSSFYRFNVWKDLFLILFLAFSLIGYMRNDNLIKKGRGYGIVINTNMGCV